MRLAQGNAGAAAAAIRRVLGETTDRLRRASLLPAEVEILLVVGELDEARGACRELEEISETYDSSMLRAMLAQTRGSVDLAAGNADAALVSLRQASHAWQELEAPYEAARARVQVGRACRALGDEDAFSLEIEAARRVFEELAEARNCTLRQPVVPRSV